MKIMLMVVMVVLLISGVFNYFVSGSKRREIMDMSIVNESKGFKIL